MADAGVWSRQVGIPLQQSRQVTNAEITNFVVYFLCKRLTEIFLFLFFLGFFLKDFKLFD